jgi:hypothetical protein
MSLNKPSYHPVGVHAVIPGVTITVRPEGEQYTIEECSGIVKVVHVDADGIKSTMPQAVWFKIDAEYDLHLTHIVAALQLWLRDWLQHIPRNIGVEQIVVKTDKSHPIDRTFSRTTLHGYLFTIMPFPLAWGSAPAQHPEPPVGQAHTNNIYYLADRKPKRYRDLK